MVSELGARKGFDAAASVPKLDPNFEPKLISGSDHAKFRYDFNTLFNLIHLD